MPDWLTEMDPTLAAAVVGALFGVVGSLIAIPLRYLIDKRAIRHRLRMEYEHAQRKELKGLIARYLGRMLEACGSFNHRMWNLYKEAQEQYLAVGSDLSEEHYYIDSMVHRFLAVCILIRGFEKEALYLDPRLVDKGDVEINRLFQAMRWSLTDVALFDGLPYDSFESSDHFFSDQLRQIADDAMSDGELLSRRELRERAAAGDAVADVYSFFDGINSTENRYRWDRLIVFHLLVMAFLNSYGDDTQKTAQPDLAKISARIRHQPVVTNLMAWIPKLGLERMESGKQLKRALKKRPQLLSKA